MELLPYPQVAHVRNCYAQDITDFDTNSPPTEPPLGDHDTEPPPFPPSASNIVVPCNSQGRYVGDVESGSPRNQLIPDYTGIPYRQRIQTVLNTFAVVKAIQTRINPLLKRPAVVQAMQTRIRRLRKLPYLVQAIQAHIEQVARISHLVRAMHASIERLSRKPPLIQVPTSDPIASSPAPQPKWCCFICIDIPGRQPVAMKIPCPPRKKGTGQKDRETKIYGTIKERLTTYYEIPRFLPFYGVKEVQEVNFQFISSVADSHGSFPVAVRPLILEQIEKKAGEDIRYVAEDYEMDGACDRGWHTDACEATMQNACIHAKAKSAKIQLRNVAARHLLLKSVRSGQAEVIGALEGGWVQRSCVMHTGSVVMPKPDEAYNETQEIPGLKISLGWQYDLIGRSIPLGLVWGLLAVSIVSLCTVWWKNGTQDTGTALAFGQLVAALIGLVFVNSGR